LNLRERSAQLHGGTVVVSANQLEK
jgi:hypothetical protein